MISIIVPTRFRVDLTRVCLDSVFAYTPEPFEVIIVQEGDEPGMAELLKRYNAKCIYHKTPLGYCKAINAGYAAIDKDAEFVIFLNSDTVVTPGWIEAMLKAYHDIPETGLVAPRLSEQAGPQSVENNGVRYRKAQDIKGAVVLMRRDFVDVLISENEETNTLGLGPLDERFGLGGGDDNDLCFRVRQKGKKVIIAYESFVYHYNSACFRELFGHDVAYSRRYASQQLSKFKEKWRGKTEHKPYVMVAVPCLDGYIHEELMRTVMGWERSGSYIIDFRTMPYSAPVDSARNAIVKAFLETTHDYLLFIDADVVPPLNAVQRLIDADKDIIGAMCMTFRVDDAGIAAPMPLTLRQKADDPDGYEVFYSTGVDQTDVVAGGAFLVKRRVFEAIKAPFSFTYDEWGRVRYSEDVNFSRKAKSAGFEIYTAFDCRCKHYKETDADNANRLLAMLEQNRGRQCSKL